MFIIEEQKYYNHADFLNFIYLIFHFVYLLIFSFE